MKLSTSGMDQQTHEGEKCLNSELWHACAGPLVSLPTVGSRVVYSPQGHSEQVAATTNKEVDAHIPNYPSLSPQMICQLHNVTMHADVETDEVYAQMTLQPLTQEEQKDVYLPVELGVPSMQPTNYFCKTLTASDTSTHGGFSVPRRAAEKVFPPLDFSQTPPVQELVARDLHDVEWKFRHIFRGQPKRHLLTTGWSVFVSAKRLVAGDSVLFIWNQKNQLFLGIRRAIRPQTVMPSSVLSSDSMHIGLLAAAAHATATNSCFTVFFNPRASPSEFVIPLSKYVKAVCHTRVSVGMRFRMLFETEESTVRRYMGTITGIGDLDPVRWPKSHWRSVKVGWDESTAGERQPTVSLWDIEPLTTFPMYASLFPPRLKRPWYPGASSFQIQDGSNEAVAYFRGEAGEQGLNPTNMLSPGMLPWMQQRFDPSLLRNDLSQQYQAMLAVGLQNQFMQLQQPVQVPTQTQMLSSNIESPLQQQIQNRTEELQQQQQIIYQEPFLNNHLQPRESDFLSASNSKFPSSMAHSTLKNLIGSFNNEGSSDLLNFSRTGQPLLNEQSSHQTWMAKFAQSPINNALGEQSLDLQNHTLFGANVGSSDFLLPTTVSRTVTSLVHADILSMPLGYQSAPYGFTQDSSELLHGTEQVDPPTPTEIFVKVSKAGSVGRSLDIARFSSYRELRQELGQMFGIQGLLEVDPQRSGWQLVFVDRENDVLLLGDDPWAEFMNNVWYIKILSPEDVQNLGKQESLSRSENAVRMMNSSTDTQNLVSGFPSLGSLEY